jgi:hypothetical protein
MIGKDHGVELDGVNNISVVTDDTGESSLSNLTQLVSGEGVRKTSELVPKSIPSSNIRKL